MLAGITRYRRYSGSCHGTMASRSARFGVHLDTLYPARRWCIPRGAFGWHPRSAARHRRLLLAADAEGRPDDSPHTGQSRPQDVRQPMEGRVLVRAGGQTSADTTRALTFFEAGYGPVQYVPLAEVATSLLRPSRRTTRCSLKGECRYLTITLPGGGHLSTPHGPTTDRIRTWPRSRVTLPSTRSGSTSSGSD
jgi:uncharacterized protein (DUF427 family)